MFKSLSKYLFDLVIVVLGITIAFQLNVWKESGQNKELEKNLLQIFVPENLHNMSEVDSGLNTLTRDLKTGLELIELLKDDQSDLDSIRIKMSSLYQISWPDYITTHLENYLDFTSANTPLREEMLTLNTRTTSAISLVNTYIEQKQVKYFDYLSDAVDMTSGLVVVDEKKIRGVQFRNNLMIISAHEDALINIYQKMDSSQHKVIELLNTQLME